MIALQIYTPAKAKIKTDSLDTIINTAIKDNYFPGAQIVIGNKEGVIYSKTYGYTDYSRSIPVEKNTLYDMASCTKVCATTLSLMTLIDQGKVTLDSRLGDIIELPDTLDFRDLKVKELLYHTSGFRPGIGAALSLVKSADEEVKIFSKRKTETNPYIYDTGYYVAENIEYDSTYISRVDTLNRVKISKDLYLDKSYYAKVDSMVYAAYRANQRGRHIYSDLNFYLLQKVVEKVAATPLDLYTKEIYERMQLSEIGYKPLEWSSTERICPTEYDVLLRRDTIRGLVHDELVCIQGGVGGSAGLFSSAGSIAQICGMFLRDGVDYNGNRIIDSATLHKFTQIERSPYNSSVYGLGFTKINSAKRPYTPESFGHSGFTGTYLWIDPTIDLYVVMLTNRTYPTRSNKKFNSEYRSEIWRLATEIFH